MIPPAVDGKEAPWLRRPRSTARFAIIAVVLVLIVLGWASTLVVIAPLKLAPVEVTRTSAKELRKAVMVWRGRHRADECPTLQRLKDDGVLDPASKLSDAWGTPFQITCTSDETTVRSFGPDKVESADDIVAPPRGLP